MTRPSALPQLGHDQRPGGAGSEEDAARQAARPDAAAAGLRHPLHALPEGAAKSAALDPFLAGSGAAAADYHSRQESADSGGRAELYRKSAADSR